MLAKPASPRLQTAHPLAAGLVGAYLFVENSGTRITDRSRRSPIHGATQNSPTWLGNIFGPQQSFNGSNQNVTLLSNIAPASVPPGVAGIAAANTGYSVIAWASTNSTAFISTTAAWSTGACIIEYRNTTGSTMHGWSFGFESGKIATARTSNSSIGGGGQRFSGATTVNDSVFRQYAVSIDINAVTLYVNGAVDGTGTFNATESTGSCDVGSGPFNVYGNIACRSTNAGGLASFFVGQIDHVLLYNRALSYQEITQLYADPFAAFRPPPKIRRLYKPASLTTASQYAVSMCA